MNGARCGRCACYRILNVTPGVPTAPRDLTAVSNPEEIVLSWTAPAYTGTPALTKYEYRYTSVDDRRRAGLGLTHGANRNRQQETLG